MAENKIPVLMMRELLTAAHLDAGADYCQALLGLGLDPDIMAWVYEANSKTLSLAIVTSLVDRIGPKSIYDVLFKAYDIAATPRAIDPFVVSLYSPNMDLAVDLRNNLKVDDDGFLDFGPRNAPSHIQGVAFHIGYAEPKAVLGVGVYRVRRQRMNADQDRGRWRRFSGEIARLAA